MNKNSVSDNSQERRYETRTVLDQYYSVEFRLKEIASTYQFKLRDISSKGMGVLVHKGSEVLKYLKVGDTLDMKYLPPESAGRSQSLKTQIAHITQKDQDPFKGHFLMGLLIIEKQDLDI
ncbi:MAG: hypothetical protein JRG87_04805 [Deltaproteobacteria bacterium]|nr:hypothetical protein [Deltaproteobacteria bacterium]MBW2226162.1 hypothetical protein [Deltaproteobacteria bacterium]